jgi:hypothetical protein
MAKNITEYSTSNLLSIQQILNLASKELHDFYGHVENEAKEGKLSTSYKDELRKQVEAKIVKNNEHMDTIDKEVYRRIERDFPGATTSKVMPRLVEKYRQEKAAHEKGKEEQPTLETKVKTLKKSKERRI